MTSGECGDWKQWLSRHVHTCTYIHVDRWYFDRENYDRKKLKGIYRNSLNNHYSKPASCKYIMTQSDTDAHNTG